MKLSRDTMHELYRDMLRTRNVELRIERLYSQGSIARSFGARRLLGLQSQGDRTLDVAVDGPLIREYEARFVQCRRPRESSIPVGVDGRAKLDSRSLPISHAKELQSVRRPSE